MARVRAKASASRRIPDHAGMAYRLHSSQGRNISWSGSMLNRLVGALAFAALTVTSSYGVSAQEKIKLKMAEVVRSQFYIPMYVALAKGFVAEEGLEVEMVTTNAGDRAGALVLSGQADFALAGPEVPIYIYNGESADKPLIFCALTATDGLFFVSRKKIDAFDWKAVSGKKVMGWRPGSTPQLYLEYVLRAKGVDDATVKSIITNISPAARDGAFLSGVADFAIFNEPNVTRLEKAGEAYFVASIGKEIGRADYTVFFAKKSWLEKNGVAAQKWTNAIAKAQAWVKTASTKDIAEAITPYFPQLPLEDNMTVVDRYRTLGVQIWAESTVMDKDGLAKAQEIMVKGGVLPADKIVPYEKLVINDYATKAQAKYATQ
jgi:NitT/TauT family transport system substrate-binding protein